MNTEHVSFQELSIEYRAGPRDTTLFVFTPHYQDVKTMEQLFGAFASGANKQVDLHTINGVRLVNFDALILLTASGGHALRAIKIVRSHPSVVIQWTMSVDSWDLCQGLLTGFTPEEPGFQYLNIEHPENPAIVFAYKTND
jgi:hypothetical protein